MGIQVGNNPEEGKDSLLVKLQKWHFAGGWLKIPSESWNLLSYLQSVKAYNSASDSLFWTGECKDHTVIYVVFVLVEGKKQF